MKDRNNLLESISPLNEMKNDSFVCVLARSCSFFCLDQFTSETVLMNEIIIPTVTDFVE